MSHYFKTELGQNALQQRHIALTARQRRLLLLIDHEDFKELNQDYKDRIAPAELVQQLIEMGLLAQQTTPVIKTEIKKDTLIPVQQQLQAEVTPVNTVDIASAPAVNIEPEVTPPLEKLLFVEIQQIMIQTLTTYCGLMARPLIEKIKSINTLQQLKACQMQWITLLQESRIPSTQLNQTLKRINYAVQHL